MSQIVSILVPNTVGVPGLNEEFASWAGELLPYDPPRLKFEAISLTIGAVVPHVARSLPPAIKDFRVSLELDERLVLALRQVDSSGPSFDSLQHLAEHLSDAFPYWAIVVDSNSWGKETVLEETSSRAVERLRSEMRSTIHAEGILVILIRP